MATTKASDICRFLDLPSELRNRIYDYLFPVGGGHKSIDISHAGNQVPGVALVRVNRQLRYECLSLYRKATTNFYDIHSLRISIDCTKANKSYQERLLLSQLAKLRQESGQGARFRWLTLHITTQKHRYFAPDTEYDIEIDVRHIAGRKANIECEVRRPRLPSGEWRSRCVEDQVAVAMADAVYKCFKEGGLILEGGLDVSWFVHRAVLVY